MTSKNCKCLHTVFLSVMTRIIEPTPEAAKAYKIDNKIISIAFTFIIVFI